ncbi:MAG TPA: C25 family cysteine peptidase [Anaerolineae bacterium]|nr:C25 family cysteine peptidase [Anaerolineae bacterium]
MGRALQLLLIALAVTIAVMPGALFTAAADHAATSTLVGPAVDDSPSGMVAASMLDSGTISTAPAAASVLLGSTTDVALRIDDVVSIYGADVRLCYNSGLVSVPADAGTLVWEVFHKTWHNAQFNAIMDPDSSFCPCSVISSHKWYFYVVTNTNPATPFTGSGRLAVLTFRGDAIGTSDLHFCYVKASDRDGIDLHSTAVDGTITVAYGRLGNMVWNDLNKNGFQDDGEPGVANVTVKLLDGSGNPVLDGGGNPITTQTASDGSFELTNMPAGTYMVEFVKPANYIFTRYNFDGLGLTGTVNSDANRTTGRTVAFTLSSPTPILYIDAGLVAYPTVASVHDVRAYVAGDSVVVGWETAVEAGTLGFELQRLDAASGEYVTVNERLIPAVGSERGASYRVVDPGAAAGGSYSYQVVEVEPLGGSITYGPYAVSAVGSGQELAGWYRAEPHPVSAEQGARGAAALAEAAQVRQRLEAPAAGKRIAEGTGSAAASGGTLKVVVRDAGLYYLSAARIATAMGTTAAQIEAWLRSEALALTNQGQDVPFLLAPNRSGIYFYGQGLDSIYTADNVYWLSRGEARTMSTVRGKVPKAGETTGSFVQTVHLEEDRLAIPAAFVDPTADYWMWATLWAGEAGRDSVSYAFPAAGAVAGSGSLTLHLLGSSDTPAEKDHHVVAVLNGHELGEGRWNGQDALALELAFDAGWLVEEGNTLVVRSVLDQGVPYSAFYVDSFDLAYPRRYRARDNVLELRADGNELVRVDGFTRPTIWVFDITDPLQPKQVQAVKVVKSGGAYQAVFEPESADSVYLVLTPDRALTPESVFLDEPSNLKNPANGADYVIIAPDQLAHSAEALAAYRRKGGLSALVVRLADIYDEFNHGLASPGAIRAFLRYAYEHWQQRPSYVLLAGEGNYDYKDNLGLGGNLIPVWMVSTARGLYAADNRFADVDDDGVPEMAVGRLPVVTSVEMDAAVARIIAYEAGTGAGWSDRVVLLADNADDGGDFAADSRAVGLALPAGSEATTIALGEVTLSQARAQLLAALHSGAGLVNYLGHAGLDRLAAEGLLTSQDVAGLDNAERMPVAALMTCAAGQFAIPGYDSLAENLVRHSGGGAVAVWAPTGWSINGRARALDELFVRALYGSAQRVLGDALLEALHSYAAQGEELSLVDIYNLLGDPALRVK